MNRPEEDKVAKIRSVGFLTKGLVYVLIGSLTFMAVLGIGGEITSKDGAIQFLLELPLGKFAGGLIALGLLAYTLWRVYEMFFLAGGGPPPSTGFKRILLRFRYFISAIFYGFLAYSFAQPLISELTNSQKATSLKGNGEEQSFLGELLAQDWGNIVIWLLVLVVAGQAIWQFRLAFTARFMKKIDNFPDLNTEYALIKKAGRIGYLARGLVFMILSYFLVRVILHHSADMYKGTQGALMYILSLDYGAYLLAATAGGLIGYGIFNLMVSRHADLTSLH